ncbi:MAG TPA: hypothetical protein VM870_10285 [Pyrinomonadaceae bacterium]|nr:hypothetical protein [Pyrinomonadaceae bacterium]
MKLFYFLLIVSFILLLLYWRLRPYIHAVQRAFKVVRQMQEGASGVNLHSRGSASPSSAPAEDRQLIKCANCATWVLESRAVAPAGTRQLYCSPTCYEESLIKSR